MRDAASVTSRWRIAADGALEGNARFLRHLQQRSFVVKRRVPLDRAERQRAIHRSALQVHISEFARQAGSDGALAGSGWTVDGNDKFALGWIGHGGEVRFYMAARWKTTGAEQAGRGDYEIPECGSYCRNRSR
jgi:hypothetical protein